MGMHREVLKQYLQNKPLVEAIRQKMTIDEIRRKLQESLRTLYDVGINEANEAIKAKLDEYTKASKAYDAMIGDVWELNWQRVEIISRYLDYDINQLPEYANNR